MFIIEASAPLYRSADESSERETECLFGEEVTLHKEQGAWCEVTLKTDGYRGWLKRASLGELPEPTHRIIAPRALLTQDKDIKTPAIAKPTWLPLGAQVSAKQAKDGVMQIQGHGEVLGYTPARLLLPLSECVADWVAIAESLKGTPYRWGGRDSIGVDCSALVQLALMAGGIASPRNSGEQEQALGETIDPENKLKRGDLIFWQGHVGIMEDSKTLLHANMYHAMVASEDLKEAIARIGEPSRVARI